MRRFSHVDTELPLRSKKGLDILNACRERVAGHGANFNVEIVALTEFRLQMLNSTETSQLTLNHDTQSIAHTFAARERRRRDRSRRPESTNVYVPFIHRVAGQNEGQVGSGRIEKDFLHLLSSSGIDTRGRLIENGYQRWSFDSRERQNVIIPSFNAAHRSMQELCANAVSFLHSTDGCNCARRDPRETRSSCLPPAARSAMLSRPAFVPLGKGRLEPSRSPCCNFPADNILDCVDSAGDAAHFFR